MKIGMLTGIWHIAEGATLLESLNRVAAHGFRFVDLHGVFHAGPAHLTSSDRVAVRKKMKDLGLVPRNYVCHAPHNIPSSTGEEFDESFGYLVEAIDLASMWGVNQLMLNAGMWDFDLGRKSAWEKSVRFIQELCDYAAPRGVFVAQEAEPYVWFLVNDIQSTKRMIEDVDRENFTTLIDLGHMALAREDPGELRHLGDTIIHAHFSDHQPFQHTNQIIGSGITPTLAYLDELRGMDIDTQMDRFGYDELVISFELGVPGDQIPNPDERVTRSLEFVTKEAPFLEIS